MSGRLMKRIMKADISVMRRRLLLCQKAKIWGKLQLLVAALLDLLWRKSMEE
jgi:hypothetical protein